MDWLMPNFIWMFSYVRERTASRAFWQNTTPSKQADCTENPSNARHELGHDHDGDHLHGALARDSEEEAAHHPVDLVRIGIGFAQFEAYPQVRGQQIARALDGHQH